MSWLMENWGSILTGALIGFCAGSIWGRIERAWKRRRANGGAHR